MATPYIYILSFLGQDYGDTDTVINASTRKWVITEYLKGILEKGESLNNYGIQRIRDANPDTLTDVDIYEFMNIDLGETL
jgi:hypothetical protein